MYLNMWHYLSLGKEEEAIKHVKHLRGRLVDGSDHYLLFLGRQRCDQLEQGESTATVKARRRLLWGGWVNSEGRHHGSSVRGRGG